MGADRPDDAELPPDEHPDRPPDRKEKDSLPTGSDSAETRSRQEYYVDLRIADSAQKSVAARRTSEEEQAVAEKWEEQSGESRWMWGEYQRKWPPQERSAVDRPDDPPGSWRGEGNRYLEPAANGQVEAACDRVADRERDRMSPAMLAVEIQDSDRHLVGFDYRLKGHDRIKEKIYGNIKNFGRSPEQAVSQVPDTIRYTLQYGEGGYTQGVWADIGRLKDQGFELHKIKNSWSGEQYKGLNSQWIDPDSGQRFEVQFHTRISFEAKQLTHDAYERIRSEQRPDKFEFMVLEAFQKKVTSEVRVPPGALDIPDYP